MTATSYDFTFATNTPWTGRYQFTRDAVPVPMTGCSMKMQLRLTAASDDVAITISTDNGRFVILDGPSGVWEFNVSLIDALQVAANSYIYDLLITSAGGEVFAAITGQVLVSQGVTR
jgi:hypothetical protein